MIKGIYTSAMAMRQGILRQEITANNLANATTTGFKRDDLFAKELTQAGNDTESSDPLSIETSHFTEFTPGAYNATGDNLDFALQSKGFFVLSDGQNEVYTRAGHFERNSTGQLVDVQGRMLQGEGGNITVPDGVMTVSADGRVTVDGKLIDRFRVVKFDNPQTLRKAEGSAFAKSPATGGEISVDQPVVRQGFLEASNVDTVKEMVQMISTARNYEINAKLLTAQDDTLRQVVGDLGRV
jgi:flagellar basal-body rod protein FlgF